MSKEAPEITVSPLIVCLFCTPIFFINFFLPAIPQTAMDIAINDFLDNQLLGLIGFWSSLFPFSSKATANYIAIAGPICATTLFCKTYKTMNINPAQYKKPLFPRFVAGVFFTPLLVIFYAFVFYLTDTDLGRGNGRYGKIFGQHIFFYSIYSSAMLFVFFLIPILIHRAFFYFPWLLIKNWKEKQRCRHSG
ncbi:colicin immunity protein Cui [Pseudomonas koreensis]|uniref:Colicin immunity protein Cui n=1 Tax=Pseudomonas koreensis TaxID=198620 RepID=A0A9X2XFL8_9PSED|nr:colicin immunity protein Cui [Pseudomonas koreensis]MCU7248070.1 colicin immunity protein Cui [Pseudomonas koreensis]